MTNQNLFFLAFAFLTLQIAYYDIFFHDIAFLKLFNKLIIMLIVLLLTLQLLENQWQNLQDYGYNC